MSQQAGQRSGSGSLPKQQQQQQTASSVGAGKDSRSDAYLSEVGQWVRIPKQADLLLKLSPLSWECSCWRTAWSACVKSLTCCELRRSRWSATCRTRLCLTMGPLFRQQRAWTLSTMS